MSQTLKLGLLTVAVTCGISLVASPALSQETAAPRPSGGLFGPTRSDVGARDKLTFLFAGSEGLENELPPEFGLQVPQNDLQSGGLSSMLTATADYAHIRRLVQLSGAALTAFKYYPRLDRVAPVSHGAALGASFRLPKQSSLQIAQTAAYSPSYLYQLFPTAALPVPEESIPVNPDYRIVSTESYSYGTKMALSFGSVRGTQVTTTADYNHTDFQIPTVTRPNPTVYAAGAKVSRAVSHNSGVSVEYQYRAGDFGFVGRTKEHRVTMGMEYARPVSRTRHATFRLELTPAALEVPASALNVDIGTLPSAAHERLYRLQGEASVAYEFRPNWRATSYYRRGVEYLAVLTQPVFTDGARVELVGLLGRRVDLLASAGYATAASALTPGTRGLETGTGNIRVRYALKRSLAVYSEYLYYYYDLRGQVGLAPGMPAVFRQHGIHVGFMLYVRALGK